MPKSVHDLMLTGEELILISKLLAFYEQTAGLCPDKKLERELSDIPQAEFNGLKSQVELALNSDPDNQ
jgi:hypothetical protein